MGKCEPKTCLLKDGREFTIREAEGSDAEEILQYLRIIGSESDNLTFGSEGIGIEAEKEREILEGCREGEEELMAVAVLDGKIVGQVGSHGSIRRERRAHVCTLGISVLKEFWGLGLGSSLMDYVMDWSGNNYKIMELEVLSENSRAITLYEKKGFVKFGETPYGMYIDERYRPLTSMYKILK